MDKDILNYSCGWENERYYNIKTDKEVTKNDIDQKFRNSSDETGDLHVYTLEKGKGVFNSNNELLLGINNNEYFKYVYQDFYKLTKADGSVEYYKLKGSAWNY